MVAVRLVTPRTRVMIVRYFFFCAGVSLRGLPVLGKRRDNPAWRRS